MTLVRLKYLHSFVDRHGHVRYYFRYRGKRWLLPAPEAAGFATAYEALKNSVVGQTTTASKNIAFMRGTLGWGIEQLFCSEPYKKDRAATTKRNHRRVGDELRQRFGAGLLKDLKSRHVKIIRNTIRDASTTTAADIAVGMISTIWDFVDENFPDIELDANPTIGVRRIHEGKKEHEPWPQDLIDRFLQNAPPSLCFAVRLALCTGQRRSDLVKMKRLQFDGTSIEVRQQKGDELLSIPCHPSLRDELCAMPRDDGFILLGERGGPLKAASLSVMVTRQLRRMGITGYSIHGLRKNAGNALAEAGCTDHEIRAITGHRTLAMVAHYTKRANQKALARSAMDKLELAESGKPKNATGSR